VIKVLHVGKYYPPAPGGMERVVQLLCESEQPLVSSHVLVANTTAQTVHDVVHGVPVTRVASIASIGSVGVCPTFPLALASAQRDLTVIHEPNPLALASDFLARQQGPLVLWFHSEVLRPRWKYRLLYRPFLKRVLARAARIVVSSPNLATSAEELVDHQAKCVVIPFGIEPGRFAPTPERDARAAALRERHGGRPIVLFVGRLVPYKGVSVLLESVRDLDVTTVIVGSGPMRHALERQAAGDTRVVFAGDVGEDTLAAWYRACDVFVLPSVTRAEAFGMVQLEAMAAAKPVVSTRLASGVPWVNCDRETGFVVEPSDPAALRDAIALLMRDARLRAAMGAAGAARVAADFTVTRMAERTVALYEQVLAEAVAGGPVVAVAGPTSTAPAR
jgi:rhamnosyl/mannosyltransferase